MPSNSSGHSKILAVDLVNWYLEARPCDAVDGLFLFRVWKMAEFRAPSSEKNFDTGVHVSLLNIVLNSRSSPSLG